MEPSKMSKNNTENTILAIEMQLNAYEEDLIAIRHDIDYLSTFLGELNKAYVFLKKPHVIVSISEYRKVIVESSHVVTKIQSLKNSMVMINKSIESKLKALEYYNMLFQAEYEDSLTKVLPFARKLNDGER